MIKLLVFIVLHLFTFLSFSRMEQMPPYFELNSEKKTLSLDGEVSLLTNKKLEHFLRKEYYQFSKRVENRNIFKERGKKVDIKRISYLINTHPAMNKVEREYSLRILKYLIRLDVQTINLNSPGGHLIKVVPLALLIKELGLSVHVKDFGICASACSYLFHQSSSRSMGENSQLMYHLGVIQQGKDIFHVNSCHAFDMKNCNLNAEFKFVLDKYKHFINSLPEDIKGDVMAEKDRFISVKDAMEFNIIN